MKSYLILTINPGSTSTKIGLFRDEKKIFITNITHQASEMEKFPTINDQYDYRRDRIVKEVEAHGYRLEDVDVFSARGGRMVPCSGGVYEIDDTILAASPIDKPIPHAMLMSPHFAAEFARSYNGVAYTMNPQSVDEFMDKARVTGFHDAWRTSAVHSLNQKEVGVRVAKQLGKKYEELNMVIAHVGGGITITAHKKGKMVDSTHSGYGDGPMAPTRSGSIPVHDVIVQCFSGKYTEEQMHKRVGQTGGLVDHIGLSDVREVEKKIADGDSYARLILDGMYYQIAKHIASMTVALEGSVDAVVLTGGISRSQSFIESMNRQVGWIAPMVVMAGEFEMEALANGALRVLRGEEAPQTYTGKPVFNYADVTATRQVYQ